MLPTLLPLLLAPALAEQTLRVTVVAPSAMRAMRLKAKATWLGEERELDLLDDGSREGDVAGDGLWTGTWRGEPVTLLPLEIEVRTTPEAEPVSAWRGTEALLGEDDSLAWRLHLGPSVWAERTALPRAPVQVSRDPGVQVLAATAWALFVLNAVGWLMVPALQRLREQDQA